MWLIDYLILTFGKTLYYLHSAARGCSCPHCLSLLHTGSLGKDASLSKKDALTLRHQNTENNKAAGEHEGRREGNARHLEKTKG